MNMEASSNDSSESSDNEDEQMIYEKEMMETIEKFYCPINVIPGIKNEIIEYIQMEEYAFMEQMVQDSYLLNTVQDLFTEERTEKCMVDDECKASMIMMVTRDLSRRADLCCELANEVITSDYPPETITKVEKEIRTFMLMLEPFTLTEEDIKKEEKLEFSHYAKLSILHQKVRDASGKVLRHQKSVTEGKVALDRRKMVLSDDVSGYIVSETPNASEILRHQKSFTESAATGQEGSPIPVRRPPTSQAGNMEEDEEVKKEPPKTVSKDKLRKLSLK